MKQRQLTQEELNLAPEWASRYSVDEFNAVLFESDKLFQWLDSGVLGCIYPQVNSGISMDSQPIPRKAFDVASIESPNMHDMDQPYIRNNDDGTITVDGKIDKYLVIAIAKALGVTAEDFK